MRRVSFLVGLGVRDVGRSLVRVIVLWLSILMATVASLLAVVVWQDARASASQAASFAQSGAVSFQVVDPGASAADNQFGWPGPPLDELLRETLTPTGSAATVIMDYPESPYAGNLYVCVGYWPQFWATASPGNSGVLIGADVTDLAVGDTVYLGAHIEQVIGRLPAGATLMASNAFWDTPADLNRAVVFLTSYGHFVDTMMAGYSDSISAFVTDVFDYLRVYHWTDTQVASLVDAVAQATPWRLLPRALTSDSGYVAMRSGALALTWVAVGLAALALIAFVSVLAHTVGAMLKNQSVHRLFGATIGDCRVRLVAFIAVTYAVPALLVVLGWSFLPIPELGHLRPYLWWVAGVILIGGAVAVETAGRLVARQALLLATRRSE